MHRATGGISSVTNPSAPTPKCSPASHLRTALLAWALQEIIGRERIFWKPKRWKRALSRPATLLLAILLLDVVMSILVGQSEGIQGG